MHKIYFGIAVVVIVNGVIFFNINANSNTSFVPKSYFLNDLTWQEVESGQQAGIKSVIIPTAGTEQNGPYAVLGKHSYVIQEVTKNITAELGDVFVAPILHYVPEGAAFPERTGHMRYNGTISIPNSVFSEILYYAGESLIAHGFKEIYFLGDSGDSQQGQAKAAAMLRERFPDVIVHSLNGYYSKNGQFDYLLNEGYTEAQIGYHAGIRDFSELLAVKKDATRPIIKDLFPNKLGYSGDPKLASTEIGNIMISLKVDAALKEIRHIRNPKEKK